MTTAWIVEWDMGAGVKIQARTKADNETEAEAKATDALTKFAQWRGSFGRPTVQQVHSPIIKKQKTLVVAHQLLAASRIIVEQLTSLGYDDQFAESEYDRLKAFGVNDQAAIRLIAKAVTVYDKG